MDEIIRIKDLCGGYAENQVIKNLSLDISKGGFTAIAGPNGAGKSTLLKYLIKELGCPESTIFIENRDIRQISQLEIARLVSFQGQYVPKGEEFTVREVVSLGRFSYGDVDRNMEEVEKALKLCRIEGLADKYVTRISGGEFQLAMLARTICQNSEILALDEPINNLDPRHQIMLMDLLKDLSNKGKTVLCVMHDLNAILRSCDKCILLKDGTIFSYGETKSVLTEENIKTVYGIDVQIIVHQGKSVILFK
ncbi:MAG: ABC transporter ATP-binding protein [Spirochaetales bacterium]|nr:ABC transporter ATP-binding protein [Spirochaetales bacterium]